MIDTHAHLNFQKFAEDVEQVIGRMGKSGVDGAIVVGSDLENSKLAVDLAESHSNLWAAVGVHPVHADSVGEDTYESFRSLLKSPRVVAIGETGLDYIEDPNSNPGLQERIVNTLIDLADTNQKPVIFHSRESETRLLEIIQSHQPQFGGVMHCFSGSWDNAKRALDLGLLISFTGRITYPKNEWMREVAKKLPHDRVMIETDCPLLPPQSKRGQRCEPTDVIEVASTIASLWQKELEYVDAVTTASAKKFFHI